MIMPDLPDYVKDSTFMDITMQWGEMISKVGFFFRIVSSTFQVVQILVHSNFDLVSWLLALKATEPVSEPVTQMVVELINIHIISVQQKRSV